MMDPRYAWNSRRDAYEAELWRIKWGGDGGRKIVGIENPIREGREIEFKPQIDYETYGWETKLKEQLASHGWRPLTTPPHRGCPAIVISPTSITPRDLFGRLMHRMALGDKSAFDPLTTPTGTPIW